jgi:hypothetical protein
MSKNKNNTETEKSETEKKKQKTIGEYGYVRVNIFDDEFDAVNVSGDMYGSTASQIIREKLGLAIRKRASNPINALIKEIGQLAKEKGKFEDLKKMHEKLLNA